MTLPDRLKRALEFRREYAADVCADKIEASLDKDKRPAWGDIIEWASQAENARLAPIHAALIECVEALEKYAHAHAIVKTIDGEQTLAPKLTPAGEALERLSLTLGEE